jgi:type II secretory pathway pseudopilin PulG
MELLVVLFIISLLASMLTGAVMIARGKGGETRTQALVTRLALAINQYANSFGDYPPGSGGADSAESLIECLGTPKWTSRLDFDPKETADTDGDGRREVVDHWGQPLSYYHHRSYSGPPRESTFRLESRGKDGKEGTRDDITNYE